MDDNLKQVIMHELNTPIGWMSPLVYGCDNEESFELLKKAHQKLFDKVRDLRDATLFTFETSTDSYNPYDIVKKQVEEMSIKESVPITFKSDEKKCQSKGNARSLALVVNKLLENALLFSSREVVVVEVETRRNTNGRLVFKGSVQDRGIGIHESVAEKIFEPFFQVSQGSNRKFDGLGLGLSIVRLHMKGLNGEVILKKSTPNVGSIFEFTLPCELSL